jgi:hypothetical protein
MRRIRGTNVAPEIELILSPGDAPGPTWEGPSGAWSGEPADEAPGAAAPLAPLIRLATIALVVITSCLVVIAWSFFTSARAQQRQACIAGATASVNTFYFGNNTDTEARRAQAFVTEQMRRCGVAIIDINATTTTTRFSN